MFKVFKFLISILIINVLLLGKRDNKIFKILLERLQTKDLFTTKRSDNVIIFYTVFVHITSVLSVIYTYYIHIIFNNIRVTYQSKVKFHIIIILGYHITCMYMLPGY